MHADREFERLLAWGTLVVFGRPWRAELSRHVGDARMVAILCSAGRASDVAEIASAVGEWRSAVVPLARQHVPAEVVAEASQRLRRDGADAIVAYGGGSAIGLAKALQLETARRFIALPTTYSGSEMTALYGIREGGAKRVGKDDRVRPRVVLYDPALTLDLPVDVSVVSLFNAMAHAVDVLYGSSRTPELEAMAGQAIRLIAGSMDRIAASPRAVDARRDAMHGAYLAGRILGGATMAIHHKLAHVVGGMFDLPHAETHTALLPQVVAFNAAAAPEATAVIAAALGADDPAAALHDLALRLGAPTRLDAFGLTAEQVGAAADALIAQRFDNPRQPARGDAIDLIESARTGRRPSAKLPG